MNSNKLVMSVIGIAVAIIIIGAAMMPVLSDAQKNAGERVVYTNPQNSINTHHYDYVDSLELVASDHVSGRTFSTYTVNGQNIAPVRDYMLGVVSDGLSIQIGSNGEFAPAFPADPYNGGPNITTENTLTLIMKNNSWTLSGDVSGELYSGTYTWVVTFVEDGDYVVRNGNPTNFYNSGSPTDFILYASTYNTGELDTFYAYGDGKLTLGVNAYTAKLNFNNNVKVEGTTDVYQISTINVTVTDGETSETFTPYRALVKETIIGHKDSGAAYSLYGVIPAMVLVALLASAVMIVRGRD